MSIFVVDTSALAKRYIAESGSKWVRSWILPKSGHDILISRLTTVEMISLLMRKQREGNVSSADMMRVRKNFFAHLKWEYTIMKLDSTTFATARRLLVKHPLRTLDALQLASALQASKTLGISIMFISADLQLLAAASSEGFSVDDPNKHP